MANAGAPDLRATTPAAALASAITWRAILLGVVAVAASNALAIYSPYIVRSSRFVFSHLPAACLVILVFIVLPVNLLLGLIRRSWALTRGELLVVFSMDWVGATMPAQNFIGLLIGTLATPYYYASPENKWSDYFLQQLPTWAVPPNTGDAMRWFFEGMPPGAKIPWSVWITPLFWWACFMGSLALVGICVVTIFRKQWVERERLPFPLAEVPILFSEGSPVPNIFRSRLFWTGVGIAVFIASWNILTWFYPSFPEIPIWQARSISIGRYYPSINIKINFVCLGFAYFTHLDVLLSIWFFHLLNIIQIGIFNRYGITIGPADMWGSMGGASFEWQGFGAFTAMTFAALWMARRHLWDVLRKALGRAPEIDDREELLSYRVAVIGLVMGIAYALFWLWQSGMSFTVAGVFLGAMLVMYIGVTRYVVESGQMFMRAPLPPQSFTFYSIGITNMGPSSATSLALSYAHFGLGNSFVICPLAHVSRLGALIPGSKRRLLAAVLLAILVGSTVAATLTLYFGYNYGAANFGAYTFQGGNQAMFENLVSKMKNPFLADWKRMSYFGLGALVYWMLAVLRYRFAWWPLSPLGFAASAIWVTWNLAFSIFLVWLAKFVILKFGGLPAYRRGIPLFVGLLVGYIIGIGISFIVDCLFFKGDGHMVNIW